MFTHGWRLLLFDPLPPPAFRAFVMRFLRTGILFA